MALLEYRLLGPVEALRDGVPVPLGGAGQRALLARLLLADGAIVPADVLLEELFPSRNALQAAVSRLRRALGEEAVMTRAPGYVVTPAWLDAEEFERLVRSARELEPEGAAEVLRQALALWRGGALADLSAFEFAQAEIRRLEELRLNAVCDRIDADLELGAGEELIGELEALIARDPLQERLRGQLMTALYRAGRQADALAAYQTARRFLREELGLEPGRALQELERSILLQEPSVERVRTVALRPVLACPFKGLATFDVGDADVFFGRERLVSELVARLAERRLVGILGASGAGKSSLLRAGLLPALAGGALPGSERWRIALLRPGDDPLAALRAVQDADLIAVDQLEELFASSDAEAFLAALVEQPARVVVTMRADLYGHAAVEARFAERLSAGHVLVGPMGREELARAITSPADLAGLEVEPELVDALVGEVSGAPGGLPLLSTALLELWRTRDGERLTLAAHHRAGGVQGAIARLAEGVFERLDAPGKEAARRILLRLAGRRVPLDELDPEVLSILADARLVTVDAGFAEVAHEALLREWPRLAAWLADDREGRALHHRLAERARAWEDDADLLRGGPLVAAVEWFADRGQDLNERERAFLEASQAASQAEAVRERRISRRLRALLAAAVVGLVVAVIAGALASSQRGAARREATAAQAQRLGASALTEASLDRSLLLAREATALDNTVETRSTLLAALVRAPAAIRVAQGTGDRVQWVALSPDGRTLAVGDNVGGVTLFAAPALRRLAALTIAGGTVNGAFSPDGRTLAVAGSTRDTDAFVSLVDVAGRRVRERFAFEPGWGSNDLIAWSPDGSLLATGEFQLEGPRTRLTERSAQTFAIVREGPRPSVDLPLALEFSPDGRQLVYAGAVGQGGITMSFDARTLRRSGSQPVAGPFVFSPDGRTMVIGREDGRLTFVDVASGRRQSTDVAHTALVQGLAYSEDGRTLMTVGDDRTVLVWDAASRSIRERLAGHAGRIFGPVLSPAGDLAYTTGLDGLVIAWDLSGGRRLGRGFEVEPPAPLNAAVQIALTRGAVSDDGRLAFVGGPDGRVRVVDLHTRRVVRRLAVGDAPVTDVAAHDGRLVAGLESGDAVVVDPVTGATLARVPRREVPVSAIDAAGRVVAVAAVDGTVALADARDGHVSRVLRVGPRVLAVRFSGRSLLIGAEDGIVSRWDVATGRRVWQRRIDRWGVMSLAVGGSLVAGGAQQRGDVHLLRIADGRAVGTPLHAVAGYVSSVDFSPSGRTLATAGTDGTVRLWDVATRKPIGTSLPGEDNVQASVAFLPGGREALAVYDNGHATLWNLDPGDLQRRACAVAGRRLTRAEWAAALPGRSYAPAC